MSKNTLYNSTIPKRPLRADGNLSYLDFIRVVEKIWSEAHPHIPFVAAGLPVDSRYPCIIYSLANRVPHPAEPKPKQREILVDKEKGEFLIISAQRFVNWIKFSAVDKVRGDGAQMAEQIIETFEDFMMEYTPVFKKLGLSDFMYMRRIADDEESRVGEGIVKRSVVYSVTIEKQIEVVESKLLSVMASITIGEVSDLDPSEIEDGPRDLYKQEIS